MFVPILALFSAFFFYLIKCLEILSVRYFISLLLRIKCILLLYLSDVDIAENGKMKCSFLIEFVC